MKKIKEIAEKIQNLQTILSKLNWTHYTTGFDFGIEEKQKELIDFYKKEENYKHILKKEKEVEDEIDKRKVKIMKDMFEPYHLSEELNEIRLKIRKLTTKLSNVLNTFRYEVDGKKVTSVEIYQILSTEDDENLRKKAYMSRKQINKPLVDNGFIDLINLRKEFAQKAGYDNFVDYKLDKQELSSNIFEGWVDEVHQMLEKMNKVRTKYAQKYLNKSELKPWDTEYVQAQFAPVLKRKVNMLNYKEVLNNFFSKFGINLDEYNITYDIFSRNNKSEWGYNFPIEYGKDSRILANVKNMYKEFGVLLHESGHGIHAFKLDPENVILNFGISGIIFEGIANLFGSFLHDEFFYKDIFQKDYKDISNQMRKLEEWFRINSLRAVPNILFDQRLYKNKIKSIDDITDIYWNTYKEVLKEKPYAEQPIWAYRIHHTTHPIYLHNYLMGDVTYKMIKNTYNKKNGTDKITENPKDFMNFMDKKVIEPSGRYPYEELFEKISGRKFSLEYLKK